LPRSALDRDKIAGNMPRSRRSGTSLLAIIHTSSSSQSFAVQTRTYPGRPSMINCD